MQKLYVRQVLEGAIGAELVNCHLRRTEGRTEKQACGQSHSRGRFKHEKGGEEKYHPLVLSA